MPAFVQDLAPKRPHRYIIVRVASPEGYVHSVLDTTNGAIKQTYVWASSFPPKFLERRVEMLNMSHKEV